MQQRSGENPVGDRWHDDASCPSTGLEPRSSRVFFFSIFSSVLSFLFSFSSVPFFFLFFSFSFSSVPFFFLFFSFSFSSVPFFFLFFFFCSFFLSFLFSFLLFKGNRPTVWGKNYLKAA